MKRVTLRKTSIENKILSQMMVIFISWQQTGIVRFQIKLLDYKYNVISIFHFRILN